MFKIAKSVTITAVLLVLLGCSEPQADCQLPTQKEWIRLDGAPRNLADVLSNSESAVVDSLSGSTVTIWYERTDGSLASCQLGAEYGQCGQDAYIFERSANGWSAGRYYAKLCFEGS